MADLLCLKGDPAFSAFRLQRLQSRLAAALPDIESVAADYWHFAALKRPLAADERSKLAALLEERAAGAEAGELFLVTPRIGTISPWSSKATDIAWNCDLAAIERIERGVAYRLTVKGGRNLSADERKTAAALLHDRMTESVLPGFEAAGELFVAFGEGQGIEVGGLSVTALLTPGHAAEHNCYVVRAARGAGQRELLISGDLIFAGSLGGGYYCCQRQLKHARRVLAALPNDALIAPGHGPLSTAGNERRFNPFLG